MSAQDRIDKNREHGRTLKERIQNSKQVTGDEIFCNSYSRLVQTILEVRSERKDNVLVKQEGMYKNNIQDYRHKKQQINKLLTSLTSKELDKWSISDLNKIINQKKVKDDDETHVRKKNLFFVVGPGLREAQTHPTEAVRGGDGWMSWLWGRQRLCKDDKQHQFTPVLIWFFCVDHVNILRTVKYFSLYILHKLVP